jgi:hypothetical protein
MASPYSAQEVADMRSLITYSLSVTTTVTYSDVPELQQVVEQMLQTYILAGIRYDDLKKLHNKLEANNS